MYISAGTEDKRQLWANLVYLKKNNYNSEEFLRNTKPVTWA